MRKIVRMSRFWLRFIPRRANLGDESSPGRKAVRREAWLRLTAAAQTCCLGLSNHPSLMKGFVLPIPYPANSAVPST